MASTLSTSPMTDSVPVTPRTFRRVDALGNRDRFGVGVAADDAFAPLDERDRETEERDHDCDEDDVGHGTPLPTGTTPFYARFQAFTTLLTRSSRAHPP